MNWNEFWTWYLQVAVIIGGLLIVARLVLATVFSGRGDYHVQTKAIEDLYEGDEEDDEIIFSSGTEA